MIEDGRKAGMEAGMELGKAAGMEAGKAVGIEENTKRIITNMIRLGKNDKEIMEVIECDQTIIDEVKQTFM